MSWFISSSTDILSSGKKQQMRLFKPRHVYSTKIEADSTGTMYQISRHSTKLSDNILKNIHIFLEI